MNMDTTTITTTTKMNQRQWQEVEAIVRREQTLSLQHMNTKRYDELGDILDHLYNLAHSTSEGADAWSFD